MSGLIWKRTLCTKSEIILLNLDDISVNLPNMLASFSKEPHSQKVREFSSTYNNVFIYPRSELGLFCEKSELGLFCKKSPIHNMWEYFSTDKMYVFIYLLNMMGLLCCVTVRCSVLQWLGWMNFLQKWQDVCICIPTQHVGSTVLCYSALQCVAMMGLSENTPSLTRCVYLYTYSIDWSVMLCYSVLRCVAVIGLSEYTP